MPTFFFFSFPSCVSFTSTRRHPLESRPIYTKLGENFFGRILAKRLDAVSLLIVFWRDIILWSSRCWSLPFVKRISTRNSSSSTFFLLFFLIRSDDAGTNANHHREWSVSRFHPRKSPAINSCWQTFREETEKKRAWIWGATGRKVEECREFLHVERETWPLFETLYWLEKVIFPFSYFFSFFFLTLFYILSFSYTVKSSLFFRNLCVPVTFVSLM